MEPTAIPQALALIDYFGIAVFAISGALLAAERRQTFVTFVFFAVVTGVGGSLLGAWLTRGRPAEKPRIEDAIREVA